MRKLLRILFSVIRETIWIAIAAACIFGGYQGYQYLSENREVVEIAPVERPISLVETVEFEPFGGPLPVRAQGFVQPFRTVELSSPTGGRIKALHPAVVELGRFSTGDVLVQLDDDAERASLNRTLADIDVATARLDLTQTQLQRTRALQQSGVASQQALDQLLSQEAELLANLAALNAARDSAEIAVANKQIVAPFDGAVLSKQQEVGSVLGGGQSVGEIYTQDRMEVVIPVREADAALIPGLFSEGAARATVSVMFAGREFVWDASVVRVDPSLDPRSRTLRVTVELQDIANPRARGGDPIASGAPPALINAFAKVEIDGISLPEVYAIPTTSLRSGNELWAFEPSQDDRGTLSAVQAEPVHVDGEQTFVTISDWPTSARLITTSLPVATPDMPLRDVSAANMAALDNEVSQ